MTTPASDNRFRGITLVGQASDPATPSTGDFRLYVDDTGVLFLMDDTGTTIDLSGSAFTDPMTTRGDIIVRNASNVTARLARGAADTYLGSDGTDVAYSAVTDAKLSTSDITTNDASTSKHGFLKKLDNNAAHFMDGTGAWATPSGGFANTASMNQLAADVTTTTAGTWYTGPTLTLAAGTWLINAVLSLSMSNKTGTVRIHDGTNTICSAVGFCVTGGNTSLALTCVVTPSGSTTYNAQATPQTNGGTILAASAFNGVGNNASTMTALRVA